MLISVALDVRFNSMVSSNSSFPIFGKVVQFLCEADGKSINIFQVTMFVYWFIGGVLMYTSGAFDLFMFSTSTLSRFFVLIIAWHQRNSSFSVRFIDLFWQYSSETDKTLERLLAMSCHNVSMYAAGRTSPLQPIGICLKAVWCASLYYGGVYVVLSMHHTAHKTPGLTQVHLSAVVYTSLDTALT